MPDQTEIYGFSAAWMSVGEGDVDENGNSPLLNLDLINRNYVSLNVHLQVLAVFGSLSSTIYDGDYFLSGRSDEKVSIPVAKAAGLHDKQKKYATTIRCVFSVTSDRGANFGYPLEFRYLVFGPDTKMKVLDQETLDAEFEYGITDPAELARVKTILESDQSGDVVIGVGPGVPSNHTSDLF